MAELLFLGTGGSMGIPVMGCRCPVCQSTLPFNKRLRPSVLIRFKGKNILIDAGPDLRTQALANMIDHVDGVIFTHAHHDHTAGIDDLRVFNMWTKQAIPCLMSSETYSDLRNRYQYIFTEEKEKCSLTSRVDIVLLERERGEVIFLDLKLTYFTFEQAKMSVNGYRIGNLGFVSDIRHYPESIYEDLEGIDILVLSALRHEPSPLHFSIDEAIQFSRKLSVKKTWLTHLGHEVDHEKVSKDLPSNVQLAYDNLTISFIAEKR